MQHPPPPSTSSPLHDQRELGSLFSSRVFDGVQPSGLQPYPDVLSSNPEASTTTTVRSAASTRLEVVGAGVVAVGVVGAGVAGPGVARGGEGCGDQGSTSMYGRTSHRLVPYGTTI